MPLSRTSDAAVEPVTLAEAKARMDITYPDDDSRIENFVIPSARQWCEIMTCRAFITQTWVLTLRGFCGGRIYLPRPPLIAIASVAYLDENDASQTWGASLRDEIIPNGDYAGHGYFLPAVATNETYPTTSDAEESVTITYTAGYGAAATAVPVALKQAILHRCDYEYSGNEQSRMAADALLWPFRVCRPDLRFG